MSDSNRVEILVPETKETTFGTPVSSTYHSLRFTGEGLKGDTASTNSNEIRADRNISSIIRTGLSGAGDLHLEWSATNDTPTNKALTLLILDALQNSNEAWGTGANFTTVTSSADKLSETGIDGAFTAGDFLVATSATTPAGNGIYKVTAEASGEVTVTPNPNTNFAGATDIVVGGVTAANYRLNGTTMRHRSYIKNFADVSGTGYTTVFGERHSGGTVDTMSLTIPTDGILTGSFGLMSSRATQLNSVDLTTSPTIINGAVVAQSIDEVMNSIDHAYLWLNGGQASLTGFTMQLQNNLRSRLQVGHLGAISVGSGFVQVSGTLQAYYTNSTYLGLSTNWSTVDFVVGLMDNAGHGYLIWVPAAKVSSVSQLAGGVNQDVIVDMQWSGFVSSDFGATAATIGIGAF